MGAADIQQHAGADFAGVCALFFPVQILRADGDVRALGGFDRSGKINVRRANNDLIASVAGTRGRKSWKKARVWSGFLYIFQLAAISFLRDMESFLAEILRAHPLYNPRFVAAQD